MFSKIVSYFSIFGIIDSSVKYSTNGEICISIERNHIYQLKCPENKSLYIKRAWYDGQEQCQYRISSTSLLFNKKLVFCNGLPECTVPFNPFLNKYTHFNILFQCKDDNIMPGDETTTQFHGFNKTSDEESRPGSHGGNNTPGYHTDELGHSTEIDRSETSRGGDNVEGDSGSLSTYSSDIDSSSKYYDRITITMDETTTHVHGFKNTSNEENRPESHGGPNYAFVVGVIVGVSLNTCIIVGVCLLRRRNASSNAQRPSKRKGMTKSSPTHDPAHGQTESENNQQAHLMNSPDAIHMSASHTVNLDNTTNESNSYSHIRNSEDDSDVTYDHTVRNAVHGTCDGDYAIAQRRITEDDYDVSGNFHQSLSNTADPVYN